MHGVDSNHTNHPSNPIVIFHMGMLEKLNHIYSAHMSKYDMSLLILPWRIDKMAHIEHENTSAKLVSA